MSVLINKDKTELIVNCNCGCDEAVCVRIDDSDKDYGYYAFVSFLNGNFYRDQNDTILSVIARKFKKIWSIIRNKDFYYAEIVMTKEDFIVFKNYINSIDVEE